jgi:hypothetical protein
MAEAVNAIQKAQPTPLSIFREAEDADSGMQFKDYKDIAVLNLDFEPDRKIWRKLQNDPNVEIISDVERSNRLNTLTYVRFIRRIPVDEPEPEPDTFQEPCEEDDPLLDDLWGE